MQILFIYAAKAIIYSGIFFGYYCFALRNKRFHYYNRFYLLMTVLLSLLLPLMKIELWQWHSGNPQVIQLFNVADAGSFETTVSHSSPLFQWSDVPLWAYNAITLYLLLTLGFSILVIFRIRRRHKVEKIEEINFINTDLEQAPFSFFNNLFWKTSLDINAESGRQIFKHELTHIRQKHSWDKLLLRIITALFWFNPVYWLLQKELALIHEFIADEKAIEDKNAEAFALMILQSRYTKNIFSPAQSFHYSPIKRRLRMLTTSSNTNYSYARRIMVLPLLAITVLFFAFKLKDDKPTDGFIHANTPFLLVVDAGHGGTDDGAPGNNNILEKDINLSIAKKLQQLASEYGITVKMTRTSDATVSLKDRVDFIIAQQPDASISIHVNSSPGQTAESEVEVYVTGNEKRDAYPKSRVLGSSVLQSVLKDFPVHTAIEQRKSNSIYVLDKNPYPSLLIECGYMNNPASVQQLTDDATIEKMARDILQGIVTYANADKNNLANASVSQENASNANSSLNTSNKKLPLYLVDSKETTAEDVQKIDVNTIQSVNVLKGDEAAVKKYGAKAANGVVLIVLKAHSSSEWKDAADDKTPQSSLTVKTNLDSLLIVLDGNTINSKELSLMNPNDIESINVLKDEAATKKYGEKGSRGVIEITSKKEASKLKPVAYFAAPIIEKEETDTTAHFSPSFPGSNKAWQEYLQRNLKTDILEKKKAPIGHYTVMVSFVVAEDGTLSDVKAANDPGYGTGAEAVRVISNGPKWTPAKQDGKYVKTLTKQAVTFEVK